MSKADGMTYAPTGKAQPVVDPGEFKIAAISLDHGHIYGMCNGLTEAGAELKSVYDPDREKVDAFCQHFPQARPAESEQQILDDESVTLVAAAAIPSRRCDLGLRVMDHGKDYFTDKAPLTTLEQLERARAKTEQTGCKYAVYYSERLHSECAVFAGQLIQEGAIGRVVQVIGMGPHRIRIEARPDWFFKREMSGGILCDIGSHQIEQFLFYSGTEGATVRHSKVANYRHKQHPELEDFGDATLVADNGATNYFRVDWLTPNGLRTWGDGRTFILGTEGYIELRKYIDVSRDEQSNHLFLVNHDREQYMPLEGKVGYPFFGQLILDCLNRTASAMTQTHAFKAAELAIHAQMQAERIE